MMHETKTFESVICARMGVDAARQMQDVAGLGIAESTLRPILAGFMRLLRISLI